MERLKSRKELINSDAVAKEAGSVKASIQKSRPGYATLIAAIEQAALKKKQVKAAADPTPQLWQQLAMVQQRLDSAMEGAMCLLEELYHLQEENLHLKQGNLFNLADKTRR